MSGEIDDHIFFVLPAKENSLRSKNQISQEINDRLEAFQSSKNGETIETDISPNIAGDLMWPIVFFLKLCGHSPLTVTYDRTQSTTESNSDFIADNFKGNGTSQRGTPQYKIQFKSFFLLWSVLWAFVLLFHWISSAAEGLVVLFGRNESLPGQPTALETSPESRFQLKTSISQSIVIMALISMRVFVAVIQSTEVLLAWSESSSLAKFLNNWVPIQKQFRLTFPLVPELCKRDQVLKRTRNLLFIFYVAIPSVLFVPAFIVANRRTNLNRLLFKLTPMVWHVSAVSLMEDVKAIMVYAILANAFGQIRDGMKYSQKWERVTVLEVKAWGRLVHSVRLQVEQAGQSQKAHQLFLIGGAIVTITSSVFILLHISWTVPNPNNVVLGAVIFAFLVIQLVRLYSKILAASCIGQEENQIKNDLIDLHSTVEDPAIQIELKFCHDMISQKPSVISFGSYANIDKQLLLAVGSQVVTYLIILLQFIDNQK